MNNLNKRVNELEKKKGKQELITAHEDMDMPGKYRLYGGDDKTLYSLEYLESLAHSQGKVLIYVTYDRSGKVWKDGEVKR